MNSANTPNTTGQYAIEVAYATHEQQKIISLSVAAGTTLAEAVRLSGIAQLFPEIDLANLSLGVFGKQRENDTNVTAGERIEIYRPLIADPKASRRQRAEKKERQTSEPAQNETPTPHV